VVLCIGEADEQVPNSPRIGGVYFRIFESGLTVVGDGWRNIIIAANLTLSTGIISDGKGGRVWKRSAEVFIRVSALKRGKPTMENHTNGNYWAK
jgi:hypothetical protein